MPNIGTYDAKEVAVIIGGINITGFAEDTFVKASKDENNSSESVSAQGDVGVAVTNNGLGTITITLNQTSPSVSYLNNLANTSKIVDAWVKSNNEVKETVGGTQARVIKPADVEFGAKISNREFEIKVYDYTVK